jgi:TonB-dependent SusC/RagA subfamily outer membrane receptor
LLVVPSLGAQQGGTVTGRVLDSQSGLPLAAVQVFVSALDLGGLTQQNGRYLLQNVPAGTHTLTVTRIGYRTAEAQVTVGGGQTVEQNFAMAEEALQLDEIIVTGTPGGTQRRAIGNAVAVVDVGDIVQDVAVSTFQDLLSGRTQGLQFTRLSGNVGSGSPIKIRGVGSFDLGASPLIYVDGVRVNNDTSGGPWIGREQNVNVLDDFNPEDIESIEIIKGPAAASLYGTEASAGVIQIITKKGQDGAPQFNISIRQGTNFLTDPAGRLGTMWTCPTDPGPGPTDCQTEADLEPYNMYDEANRYIREGYFDWPTENLYQNGHAQAYNLDVRGGSEAVRYFVSANYENEEGMVWDNVDETFRLRANVSVVLSDAFSLDVSTGYVDGYTRFGAPTRSDGGVWQDMIWSNGYYLNRINPFDNSGPGGSSNARLGGFQEHLPADVADVEATRDYTRFTGSATLRHDYGGWLNQRLVIGIDKGIDINRAMFPLEAGPIPEYVAGSPGFGATDSWSSVYSETLDGEMTYARPIVTNMTFDYSITGRYDLNESFSFGTSFGVQYYTESTDEFSNRGNGFASPLSRTINQLAADKLATTYSFIENKSLGVYIQEQMSYEDRLFLTGSVRFDDNSTFGQAASAQRYPNVQGTYVISEESFWNFDAVNSFRVRAAWGQAGRQPEATAQNDIYMRSTTTHVPLSP